MKNDTDKGNQIARLVAERLASGELPPPPPADVGATPTKLNSCSDTCASYDDDDDVRADSAPVPQAQNSCEGSDCVSYDFPLGLVGKRP